MGRIKGSPSDSDKDRRSDFRDLEIKVWFAAVLPYIDETCLNRNDSPRGGSNGSGGLRHFKGVMVRYGLRLGAHSVRIWIGIHHADSDDQIILQDNFAVSVNSNVNVRREYGGISDASSENT